MRALAQSSSLLQRLLMLLSVPCLLCARGNLNAMVVL
jgi:hypothetical protein